MLTVFLDDLTCRRWNRLFGTSLLSWSAQADHDGKGVCRPIGQIPCRLELCFEIMR